MLFDFAFPFFFKAGLKTITGYNITIHYDSTMISKLEINFAQFYYQSSKAMILTVMSAILASNCV